MGWWCGAFSRFEVHFGYPARHGGEPAIYWLHMARHDSKQRQSFAEHSARDKSRELKIYCRVMDATKQRCAAMYRDGEPVGFTAHGEPKGSGWSGRSDCDVDRFAVRAYDPSVGARAMPRPSPRSPPRRGDRMARPSCIA